MSFADILKQIDSDQTKKLAAKVPEWAGMKIEIPAALNLEQCSSSPTARYKAELAFRSTVTSTSATVLPSDQPATSAATQNPARFLHIADLTGGLGVDTFFFARKFERVLHNERDASLSAAVQDNFSRLGVGNVDFSNLDAQDPAMLRRLEEFRPDIIFLDPARRSAEGKKVFLLEDCSPNVLEMLPQLLEISPRVMLKLSPMADITMLRARFKDRLAALHIVESGGECKELLCLLTSTGESLPFMLTVTDLRASLSFRPDEEKSAAVQYGRLAAGDILFEPGAALSKSGAWKLICGRLGLKMLSGDSHLYVAGFGSGQENALGPGSDESSSIPLGKSYKVQEIIQLSGASMKMLGKKYPAAEVTARGIRMKSEDLRSRLGVRSGGEVHIFGTAQSDGEKILAVTI